MNEKVAKAIEKRQRKEAKRLLNKQMPVAQPKAKKP